MKCSYCSVAHRKKNERIDLIHLKKYIDTLKKYGCKALIFTGGGEPTLYPHFHEIIYYAFKKGFEIGLITNGTLIREKLIYSYPFSWVRISINDDHRWLEKIFDLEKSDFHENTRIGLSFIYVPGNLIITPDILVDFAHKIDAEYIRVLPDCTGDNDQIQKRYNDLYKWLGKDPDPLFLVQNKHHEAPNAVVCHQAYFRPYLSEINGGTIFPCDSIPLNTSSGKFDSSYAIGGIDHLDAFMHRKIRMKFTPKMDCQGCVFSRNVNLLQDIKDGKAKPWLNNKYRDENFV